MRIAARLRNDAQGHEVLIDTDGRTQPLAIARKTSGRGSAVNGGELLMLALATCYCNDIFREAAARGIEVESVEVEVESEFGAAGEPARSIGYRASVRANADPEAIRALMAHTDAVSEIQNTLRAGVAVRLVATHVDGDVEIRDPAPTAP